MRRILKPVKASKAKIIKLIEEKISKTRDKKKKEKLRELEDAVKEGKMQKVKSFTKELSADLGRGLVEGLITLAAFG